MNNFNIDNFELILFKSPLAASIEFVRRFNTLDGGNVIFISEAGFPKGSNLGYSMKGPAPVDFGMLLN